MLSSPFCVPAGTSDETLETELRNDVQARLRNVCADWSDEEFQQLVEDVTKTALKYVIRMKPHRT